MLFYLQAAKHCTQSTTTALYIYFALEHRVHKVHINISASSGFCGSQHLIYSIHCSKAAFGLLSSLRLLASYGS